MKYLSAVPAYGRDYVYKQAVLDDWNAGKDFLLQDVRESGYVNKDDLPPGVELHIRYKKLQNICIIKAR